MFPFLLSCAPNILFLSVPFGTHATRARLSLKQWKKKLMFLLVTLRFLSNLSITLIASLFYFFHVSAVCFNVTLKLSTGAHNGPVIIGWRRTWGAFNFFGWNMGMGGLKMPKDDLGGGLQVSFKY